MNNLSDKMPPDDIIYSDYMHGLTGIVTNEYDIDDMIFSSVPETKLHSER